MGRVNGTLHAYPVEVKWDKIFQGNKGLEEFVEVQCDSRSLFTVSLTLTHFSHRVPPRFAGKYRDTLGSRKESLTNGELNCSESECDSTSRRLSFMKMVGLGKLKRESMADHSSQGPEEHPVQEEAVEEVKPREPLSGKKMT